jgi:hypothetical protein
MAGHSALELAPDLCMSHHPTWEDNREPSEFTKNNARDCGQ